MLKIVNDKNMLQLDAGQPQEGEKELSLMEKQKPPRSGKLEGVFRIRA